MKTIESLKENEAILINSTEEYNQIAELLDKAGKRWLSGGKYIEWSPINNSSSFKRFPIYIVVFKGMWDDVLSDRTHTYIPASEFLENKLPKYWVVDVSKDRGRGRDTVVRYLRMVYKTEWGGTLNFYGYDGNAHYNGANGYDYIKGFINNPVLLTIDEFITYPEVRKALGLNKETKINKEEMKDTRFPFAITMDKAKRIMAVVCHEWQERLGKLWGKNLLIYGYVEVSEELYKEGRKVATEKVNKLLDEIFGKDEQKITYEDVMKSFSILYYTGIAGDIRKVTLPEGTIYKNNTYSEVIHKRQQAQLKLANVAKYLNKDEISEGYYMYINTNNGIIISEVKYNRFPFVLFKTKELAQQAIEILGKETIRLACQPLND